MNGRHVADRRIVEEIAVGNLTIRSPFKHEKSGVQKILHDCYKSKDTSIRVQVRCGSDEFTEFQPCIVPNESAGRKQYMLRAIGDPNYAVGFCDRTEAECLALQGIGAVQPQGERNHHPYLSKKQILEFSHRNIPEQRESFKPPYLVYLYIFSTLTNKMAPALRRSSYHLSSYLLSLHFLSLWDFILSKLLYFEQDVNGGYGLALQLSGLTTLRSAPISPASLRISSHISLWHHSARLSWLYFCPDPLQEIWLDKRTGGVCFSISSKALSITGIDDRRYWNHIPTCESRFHTIAYLQQIWWLEVDGDFEFQFPTGAYSVLFRLQLGRVTKRLGRRVCNSENIHGWDIRPVQFQLTTPDGHHAVSRCFLDNLGNWVYYRVGDFVVEEPNASTKIKFSLTQIDCTHTKGGLCVDSVLICPSSLEKNFRSTS